jgi:hypothetical protein
MVDWGCVKAENNATLDALADRLTANMRRLKRRDARERAVGRFLHGYFAMGKTEDITDTLIRDNVWVFLVKHAVNAKLGPSEARLDQLWNAQERKQSQACVVM